MAIAHGKNLKQLYILHKRKKILQRSNVKYEIYLMNPLNNQEKILLSDTLQEVISEVLRLSDLKNEIYIVKIK